MEYEQFKDEYEEKKKQADRTLRSAKTDQRKPCNMQKAVSMKSIGFGCHLKETLANMYLMKQTSRKSQPNKPKCPPNIQEEVLEQKQTEYFNMELLSLIHETCVGEQFENISRT